MATKTVREKIYDLFDIGTVADTDVIDNKSTGVIELCTVKTTAKGRGEVIEPDVISALLEPGETFTVTATEAGAVYGIGQRTGVTSTVNAYSVS